MARLNEIFLFNQAPFVGGGDARTNNLIFVLQLVD